MSSAGKWLLQLLIVVCSMLFLLVGIAFIVDPFFQFRVRDHKYKLYEWYVGPGLVKNYDYDTLIIGSSLTQNFDMNVFRNTMGVRPLHIGLGGINAAEIKELINLSQRHKQVNNCFVAISLAGFKEQKIRSRLPRHLISDGLLARFRYLMSYEVWSCYMPLNIALIALDECNWEFGEKISRKRSIDYLGNWQLDYEFGEDIVLKRFKCADYAVSSVNTSGLLSRLCSQIDNFFAELDCSNIENLVFFFPPYSALYWCNAQDEGYYSAFMQAKRYFIVKAESIGASVYDFQNADFITNLEYYRDTTHYSSFINDWMVKCFAGKAHLTNSSTAKDNENRLAELISSFRSEHIDLFK